MQQGRLQLICMLLVTFLYYVNHVPLLLMLSFTHEISEQRAMKLVDGSLSCCCV